MNGARRPRHAPRWLLVTLVVLAGVNLRPAVISLSPLLDDIQHDLGIGGTLAGLLTALPVLCFAVFGAVAPALNRRVGPRVAVGAALATVAAGLGARALAPGSLVFFLASTAALAGLALGNVIVPAMVRIHFADRIGAVTGVFSMSLSAGTTLAAAGTVPVARALGRGWRPGLAVWAGLALVAAVPWLLRWPGRAPAVAHPVTSVPGPAGVGVPHRPRLHRSPTAWAIALFFGTQAMSAYSIMGWMPQIFRDAGLSAEHAGFLLAITTGLSVPIALVLPALAARMPHQGPLVVFLTALIGAGYAGLALAPAHVAWLWAVLVGVGNGCFPVAITMISMRARVAGNTAALSGFVQSCGYLLAAVGPLATGALHELTGTWALPLGALGAFLVVQGVAGYRAGRPRFVEDDLDGRDEGTGRHPASTAPDRGDAAGPPSGMVAAR